MRKVYLTLLLVLFGLVAGATVAQADKGNGHEPVAVCHYVPAHGGSYVRIVIDDDGLHGHGKHKNDVILYAATDTCPAIDPDPTITPKPSDPPGVPDLECPEGYVPGWLDENGNPTSCVNNEPNPGAPSPEPEPEPSITTEVGEPAGPIDTPAPEEVVSVEKAPAAAAVKADTETFTVTYTG